MLIPFFDLTRQNELLQEEYQDVFSKFLKNGQTILGEEVRHFEQEFSEYTGIPYCLTCGNATDALEMALEAMGIGHGDEVIVPAFGWVSVASSVLRQGATPVFVDVGADGNVNPALIAEKIGPRTKALLIIHLFGKPCRIQEIVSICTKYKIKLIEDCAQAHGARIQGKHVGGFGEAAVFSFYPTKNLGALGDSGAVLTKDRQLFDSVRQLRDYGRDVAGSFSVLGRNSRMDEIQAAILRKKLSYLDKWNSRRQAIANQYNEVLGGNFDMDQSVCYKYVFCTEDREEVIRKLKEKGIGNGIYYPFQLDQLDFIKQKGEPLENAQMLSKRILSLPLFPELTNEEISYICEQLKEMEIKNS